MILREYVHKLSDDQKLEIIANFEEFETKGMIGECKLRFYANDFIKSIGAEQAMITVWMQYLAFECYRYFAKKHISGS